MVKYKSQIEPQSIEQNNTSLGRYVGGGEWSRMVENGEFLRMVEKKIFKRESWVLFPATGSLTGRQPVALKIVSNLTLSLLPTACSLSASNFYLHIAVYPLILRAQPLPRRVGINTVLNLDMTT